MKHRSLLIALMAIFCLSPAALALDKGPWELTLAGSGSNNNDFDAGAFGVNGSIGYFFNDALELSFRQSAALADTGSDSSWSASSRAALDMHFPINNGPFRPFIGVNFGYLYGDNVKDTWEAAPEAGIKWFANDTTFILAMVEYQFFFVDSDDADEAFDDGQFVYTLGIGFRF